MEDRMSGWARRLVLMAAVVGALGCLAPAAMGESPSPTANAARLCSLDGTQPFQLNPRPANHADPLVGARFFVDGPGTNRGFAATSIAQLLGRDPNRVGNVTWTGFEKTQNFGGLSPASLRKVQLLSKIAAQPEVKRFSNYSAGGGPGAIYSQTQKLLCRMHETDPGADALISTYFLIHSHCGTLRETGSVAAVFRRHINELAEAVGHFPTVILLETDAIDTAGCLSRAGLRDREGLLSYAINKLSRLPHAVTYVEGGTSDADSPRFAAKILNKIGVRKIRGFFLNDTHFNWTTHEIKYGAEVSRMTGGSHFIVGTQDNGRGPLLNRDPVRQGIEDLCNPPGRGLGPQPTANTGFYSKHVDAFMWVGVPGRSAGTQCYPGSAPAGLFDERFALQLAKYANSQLGPGYPSRPY